MRQTDCILFSLALARMTFARMSEAFAVQMNIFVQRHRPGSAIKGRSCLTLTGRSGGGYAIGTRHSSMGWQAAGFPQRGYLYEAGQTRSHRLALQSASRFQCSGCRGHSATGDTENDINARGFLYWTHADAGRRLASNPPEGKNQNERNRSGRHELHQWAPGQRRHKGYCNNPLTGEKWSPEMRTVTGRRPTRPFGPPRMHFPNGVWVSRA
jgi:hypothetical protein